MTSNGPAQPGQAGAVPQPSATLLHSYDDLRLALADYCELVGMSRMELDARASLADGNAAKALAKRTRKRLAWKTLRRVLGALGLALQLVRDPAAEPLDLDASKPTSIGNGRRVKHWRNVKGRAWGRRMGFARALALTAERRSEIGRIAAQARWQRKKFKPAPTSNSDNTTRQLSMF
jgi:hypothetical protein